MGIGIVEEPVQDQASSRSTVTKTWREGVTPLALLSRLMAERKASEMEKFGRSNGQRSREEKAHVLAMKVTYEKGTQTDADLPEVMDMQSDFPSDERRGTKPQQHDELFHVRKDVARFRKRVGFAEKGCQMDNEGRMKTEVNNLSPLRRKGAACVPRMTSLAGMVGEATMGEGANLVREPSGQSPRGWGGTTRVQAPVGWQNGGVKHSRYASSVGESVANDDDEDGQLEEDGSNDNEEDEEREFWLRPVNNSESVWLSSYFVDGSQRREGSERAVTALDCHPRNPQLIAAAYGSRQTAWTMPVQPATSTLTPGFTPMKSALAGAAALIRRPLLGSATVSATPFAMWEGEGRGASNGGHDGGHDEGRVLVWSLQQREQPEAEFACDSMVTALMWDTASPWVIVAGTYSGQIVSWDMRAGRQPVQKSPLVFGRGGGHAHPVYVLEKVGEGGGSMFATASMDGRMCTWKRGMLGKVYEVMQLLQPEGTLYAFDIGISAVAFPSYETDSFYVGSEGGRVYQTLKLGSGAGAEARIGEEFGVGRATDLNEAGAGSGSGSRGYVNMGTPNSNFPGMPGAAAGSARIWSAGMNRIPVARVRPSRQRGVAHHAPVTAVHCHPPSLGNGGGVGADFARGVGGGSRGAGLLGLLGLSDLVLTASIDWTCKLWYGKDTSQPLCVFEESSEYCFDVRWSPVNPSVFAVACGDGNVQVWNLNRSMEQPLARANAIDSDAGSLKQGSNTRFHGVGMQGGGGGGGGVGERPASAVLGGGMIGGDGGMTRGAKRAVNKVRWSLDGRKVIAGDNAGVVYVYDVATEVACMEVDEAERLQRKLKRMSGLIGLV